MAEFLFTAVDILGTVAFSMSGATMAIQKRMDVFGVLMMGLTTSFGGGIVRDLLLGITPPAVFSRSYMVLLALVAAFAIFAFYDIAGIRHRKANTALLDQFINIFDAIGLGAFAVVGTRVGLNQGHQENLLLCVALGTITAVGGGVLRDLFCQEIPGIFVKHIYAVAAMVGSLVYFNMVGLDIPLAVVDTTVILLVTAIRIAATMFQLNLPKVHDS